MKIKVIFLYIGLFVFLSNAFAQTVEIDGIAYNLSSDLTASVTSKNSYYSGDITIPSTVTYNGINYRVTSIGDYAFQYCTGLTSITIPNSVTSIGGWAFADCSGLTSITIPNSVTSIGDDAFNWCWSLTSITIPNSVTSIEARAFFGCSGLTSITIPNSVTSIGNYAFCSCSGLTSITIPNSVTWIGDDAFSNCSGLTSITIPNSVTSIGDGAFYGCRNLTSITIPNRVISIGKTAFGHCTGLTSIIVESGNSKYDSRNNCNAIIEKSSNQLVVGCKNTIISNSVTSIGIWAFYGCDGLTSITIPNSVTSIEARAFFGCSGLTSITIPNSVTSIGNHAFYSCSGLTSITIPNSVTWIGWGAFGHCTGLTSIIVESGNSKYDSRNTCNAIIETSTNELIAGCKNTTILNSVTSIGDAAFSGCSGLTSIIIPNSVTSIGNNAFSSCSGLTSITIPNSVTSIGGWAFADCSGLTSITIPNSVTSIGDKAFYGCDGLTSIFIPNSVTSIGNSVFPDDGQLSFIFVDNSTPPIVSQTSSYSTSFYNSVNLCVPAGSINTYRNASFWGNFIYINPLPSVTVQADHGDATISYHSLTDVEVLITPHYGYHFTQWSDGNTDNPRNVVITNDPVISAIFAKNQYSLTINSDDTELGTVNGPASGDYLDTLTINAYANFGYQFEQWSDGNTDNPRNVVITQDTAFTAQFGALKFNLVVNTSNDAYGSVKGSGSFDYQTNTTISATAKYGYHFTQWSDGNTDNPRNVIVAQNATYTAMFAKNSYKITTQSTVSQVCAISAPKQAEYLDTVEIVVSILDSSYRFRYWNDGNTENPRRVVLTQDTTFTATVNNLYVLSGVSEHGTITGAGEYPYGSYVMLAVIPDNGYKFLRWSDGTIYNPYSLVLEKDLTVEAIMEPVASEVDEHESDDHSATKIMKDGAIYIIKNGQMYNLYGTLIEGTE